MTSTFDQPINMINFYPPFFSFSVQNEVTLLFVFQDGLGSKRAHYSHAVVGMLNLENNEGQSPKNLGQGCHCINPRNPPYLVAGAEFSPIGWEGQHAHCQIQEAADLQIHVAATRSLGSGHNVPTPDHVAVAALYTRSQRDEGTELGLWQFTVRTQEWNAQASQSACNNFFS